MAGIAYLPLHGGKTPKWLFQRMVKLSSIIIDAIIDLYGRDELIERLSHPIYFQSFGCLVGYDWHSSGVTTVMTGVLQQVLEKKDYGVYIVGGKGRRGRQVPDDLINRYSDILPSKRIDDLIKYSRLSAKVDTVLLQDNYSIYHHAIMFTDGGRWLIVQQGMNPDLKLARRYHILDRLLERDTEYVTEPHKGISGSRREKIVLDLTDRRSFENKKVMIDIVREHRLRRDWEKLVKLLKKDTLYRWIEREYSEANITREDIGNILVMPRDLNWKAVRKIYDVQPRNINELIMLRGVGAKTIRAISLVAQFIYGAEPSYRDPIRYTFTVGGKDGVPMPVDRKVYDKLIDFYKSVIEHGEIGREKKKELINKLSSLYRPNI